MRYDQQEMIDRFGLGADDSWLKLRFLGEDCRVSRKTGEVQCRAFGSFVTADFNEALTVCDLLCWGRPGAKASGEFVNLRSLHTAASAPDPSAFFAREAKKLEGKEHLLEKALADMGGLPDDKGDIRARLNVFQDLDVLFRYWFADEDFPAQVQFLWDANTLQYMHYETVWYACGAILKRIEKRISGT